MDQAHRCGCQSHARVALPDSERRVAELNESGNGEQLRRCGTCFHIARADQSEARETRSRTRPDTVCYEQSEAFPVAA